MPGQQVPPPQPGPITAPGQMPMMRPDQAATSAATQALSHFTAANTSAAATPQSSLSQLAAMSQAPRPTEGGPPLSTGGMPPAGMMAQQRPGMRPFMPGQGMAGQQHPPQGMHGQPMPPQGMPGQPGMVQPPRSVAPGMMMNQPRSMAPASTMAQGMQEQQQQVSNPVNMLTFVRSSMTSRFWLQAR